MSVVLDTFNKRPGATQCYNCNYFNHSSATCFMKPRCLKCSKQHRTGECLIKERLDTPHCINCDKDGHTANWRNCPAFPKIKNKKGAPAENRNKPTPKTFTSKLANPTLSYANATSNSQQMIAQIDRSETAKKSNSKPETNKKEESTSFNDYISAMAEFRKFFKDFPGIIDAGKAFKNAKSNEDHLDIFFGVLASEGTQSNQ
ncbi:PRE_C2HC domain-containing protein [Trichonephila clavipes]|nr:PRE_C2HC domain-containing protein [Trichonephila clavipes]